MRIGRPQLVEREGHLVHRVPVESSLGIDELWFSVESRHGSLVSDRSEAALLALLLPAMQSGEDIHVEGAIAPRFLHALSGPVPFLMRTMLTHLEPVRIHVPEIASPPPRAAGVATGFSGGIDSFAVLADHHYDDPLPGFRLTHLLYNNVGAHGTGGTPVFRARFERLRPLTDRLGLPFVAVDSNLTKFYERELSFKRTYTLRNAVVAFLLQAGIGRSFHAAGTVLGKNSRHDPLKDIAFYDPILLPMISTEALDALPAGGHYTRVEKTLRLAEIEDTWNALDVCVRMDRADNCSTCKKCVRTLLALEIAGLVDRYAASFDLAKFHRGRHWEVARVLREREENHREIMRLARQRGYRFSLRERVIALTRLDLLRKWAVKRLDRTRAGGRWIRRRKVARSPIWSARR